MKQIRTMILVGCCLMGYFSFAWAGENPRDALQGCWVAQSLEVGGKAVPATEFKTLCFTFTDDRLIVRGNFRDDGLDECTYSVDVKPKPRHFEFTPSSEKKPVVGIYDVKGDELKVCLRHGEGARPAQFATKADAGLVLVVFKKRK